jgi:hypothetical protein
MHMAEHCLNGIQPCKQGYIGTQDALLFHYRDKPYGEKKHLANNTVEDKTMWKYKDELMKAVALTLEETGFKP